MSEPMSVAPGASGPYGSIHNHAAMSADAIYQAGGNQYVQHLYQRRENFVAQIASTRTKARWLIWIGALLMIGGMVTAIAAFASLALSFDQLGQSFSIPPGFKVFFLGIAVGIVGSILLTVGIVLHVIATARRRRLDNDPEFRQLPPRGYGR